MRYWIIERALEHYESDEDAYDIAKDMLYMNAEVESEIIRTITEIIEEIRNGE